MEEDYNYYNTVEFIYKILEGNYGSVHEPVDLITKQRHCNIALEGLDTVLMAFKEYPSMTNWNLMISSMANYQYWEQKRVEDERMEE